MNNQPILTSILLACSLTPANAQRSAAREEVSFPPALPGNAQVVTDTSEKFLQSAGTLLPGSCRREERADHRFRVLSRAELSGKTVVSLGRQSRSQWEVLRIDR